MSFKGRIRRTINDIKDQCKHLFFGEERAKGEGRHLKFLAALAKADVLVIDYDSATSINKLETRCLKIRLTTERPDE
jgi:hypothetical protein